MIIDGKSFSCIPQEIPQFTVQSALRSYRVILDDAVHPIETINHAIKNNFLLIDKKVLAFWGKDLSIDPSRVLAVDASENFKTFTGLAEILDFLCRVKATKNETLVVVGGGVLHDVGGFACGIYHRGMRWIHFPTTLLGMCDSCIGGKTAVNYQQAKNQMGLFYPPYKVIINPYFLKTLPEEMLQSGLGEILKYCIIGGREFLDLYCQVVQQGRVVQWDEYKKLILAALTVKRCIVEADEFEKHERKTLNYGHTFGHAVEVLSDYAIPHGSAVVIGMLFANQLSYLDGQLDEEEKNRLDLLCQELLSENVCALVQKINLDLLADVLQKDKKNANEQLIFVLCKSIGQVYFKQMKCDDSHLYNCAVWMTRYVAAFTYEL